MRRLLFASLGLLLLLPVVADSSPKTASRKIVQQTTRSEQSVDPHVSDDKIIIATLLPAGRLAEMGQVLKAVINAYFDQLNRQGGIYGRQFEVKFAEAGESPAGTRANLARLLQDENVFALVAAFTAGADGEINSLTAEEQVPLIGPLTQTPTTNHQTFNLISGTVEQARSLVNFVVQKPELKQTATAVFYSSGDQNNRVFEAIKDQAVRKGIGSPQPYTYSVRPFNVAETVGQMKQAKLQTVFFLGSDEHLLAFLSEADKVEWYPTILTTSSVGSGVLSAPPGFIGKLFLSFPTAPADHTPGGISEFREFSQKYGLPAKHVAIQISAYTAAKVFVEALKRSGKNLSREKLIHELEGMRDFSTGLMPPVSFSPNRRIGATGAYIITIDLQNKQFLPASAWISN